MDKHMPNMILFAIPEIEVIESTNTELEPLYRVTIYNDDVTTMDFVVHVLKNIFYLANEKAAEVMLTAHVYGSAFVQALPRIEAEKRVQKAHYEAGMEGFPLHFSVEKE